MAFKIIMSVEIVLNLLQYRGGAAGCGDGVAEGSDCLVLLPPLSLSLYNGMIDGSGDDRRQRW